MEITLKNKEIFGAFHALQALDKVDDKGKLVYKFPSTKFRLALSKRLKRLLVAKQEVEDLKVKIQKELGIKADGTDDKKLLYEFGEKVNEMLEDTETLEMAKLKLSELALDTNDIPSGVLADLDCIFEDDVSEPVKA